MVSIWKKLLTFCNCQHGSLCVCLFVPLVTGNMAAMQGAGTLQGQPQPSPSQQGQFIFTPVPQMPPGQPPATGPHQGQVTPGQFGQSPLVYLPQVTPNASVPTSASSSVSYMPGKWFPGT